MAHHPGSAGTRFVAILLLATLVFLGGPSAYAKQEGASLYEDGKKLLKSGDHDRAVDAFSRALVLLGSDERNAHTVRLARAQAYIYKDDLEKAWDDVKEVLNSVSVDGESHAAALRLRAILNSKKQRYKNAVKHLTEAIKIQHDDDKLRAACFSDRGVTYINLGDPAKAVSDLTKAIELNPESGSAFAARAMAHLREDRMDAARRDAEAALRMNSGKQADKMARKVLQELSAFASGPASVSVPVDDRGHVFVQMRFSKDGPAHRFLLDTGATNTLVDHSLLRKIAEETEVTPLGKGRGRIANGATITVSRYKVKNAFIYHLPLGEIEVHVMERPAGKAQYLLGVRSLKNVSVTIDNAKRQAEIKRTESEASTVSDAE